jgi:hypothetical protein
MDIDGFRQEADKRFRVELGGQLEDGQYRIEADGLTPDSLDTLSLFFLVPVLPRRKTSEG